MLYVCNALCICVHAHLGGAEARGKMSQLCQLPHDAPDTGLLLNLKLSLWELGWLAANPRDSLELPQTPQCWDYRRVWPHLVSYMEIGDQNSGLCVSVASVHNPLSHLEPINPYKMVAICTVHIGGLATVCPVCCVF